MTLWFGWGVFSVEKMQRKYYNKIGLYTLLEMKGLVICYFLNYIKLTV